MEVPIFPKRLIIKTLIKNEEDKFKVRHHKSTAPKMPKLGKGTECVQLLLSQVSKDMHEPLVPMFSLFSERRSVRANFSIPTTVGRNYVA